MKINLTGIKTNSLLTLMIFQLLLITNSFSQNIAINGTGSLPDTSAMLDITSTIKGFLAPRMTTAQQNAIPLPAKGLLIFNLTDNIFKVNTGTTAVPVWSSLATGSGTTTNLLGSSTNTLTSTVNGVAATASLINTNLLSLSGANLTSTINGVASTALNLAPAFGAATWALGGNTGIVQPAEPATYGTSTFAATENYLGTDDAKDLVFGTANKERMRILNSNGYVGIGIAAPTKPLDLVSNLPNVGMMKIQNTNATGYSSIDIWSNTTQVGNIGYANSGAVYANSFYFATNTTANMLFATSNIERMRIDGTTGNIGIGVAMPTSLFQVAAGTATAGTAPLKLTTGTNLTVPENGAVEYDGNNYYATSGGVRYILAETLTGTVTSDLASTNAQQSRDVTITVTGAIMGDPVSVGSSVLPPANSTYTAFVSAVNTVTVRFCNFSTAAINPPSTTFRVSVTHY